MAGEDPADHDWVFIATNRQKALLQKFKLFDFCNIVSANNFLMQATILSAPLLDVEAYSLTFFYVTLLSFMILWVLFAVKHIHFCDMIVLRGRKQKSLLFYQNSETSSDLLYLMEQDIFHPVRLSTATRINLPQSDRPQSVARNQPRGVKKCNQTRPIVVLYFRMFVAFWKPSQVQTYLYASETTLGHQYLSALKLLADSNSEWPLWCWEYLVLLLSTGLARRLSDLLVFF